MVPWQIGVPQPLNGRLCNQGLLRRENSVEGWMTVNLHWWSPVLLWKVQSTAKKPKALYTVACLMLAWDASEWVRQEAICQSRKEACSNQSVDELGSRAAICKCHCSIAVPRDSELVARNWRWMAGRNVLTDRFRFWAVILIPYFEWHFKSFNVPCLHVWREITETVNYLLSTAAAPPFNFSTAVQCHVSQSYSCFLQKKYQVDLRIGVLSMWTEISIIDPEALHLCN